MCPLHLVKSPGRNHLVINKKKKTKKGGVREPCAKREIEEDTPNTDIKSMRAMQMDH